MVLKLYATYFLEENTYIYKLYTDFFLMQIDDTILIEGLRARQEFAYAYLFREHFRPLYAFAANYIYDEDAARDIVQGLFVELFEKADKLRITTSVSSYLYSATRNRCLNFLRARKIKDTHINNILEAHINSNTVEESDNAALAAIVRDVMSEMPPKVREVFRMRIIEEFKFKEIAERLGITENNAKVQMNNALRIIRRKLSLLFALLFC